jgi:FKBP-type peptidyl-prolyl cis-trans isomerase
MIDMKRYSVFSILFAVIALAACNKLDYNKTASGLVYKIFGNGKGELIKNTDFVKFHIENKVNDSVYRTTFDKAPVYVQAAYVGTRYDVSELWTKLRKGDSVIIHQSLDTFIKRGSQLPPEIKKGDKLIVTIKILDVFTSDAAAQSDQQKGVASQVANEKEDLKKYFKEKNIEGVLETPLGAFIKITSPGSGIAIDSGKYVSVMYRGSTLGGMVFDTNMDSTFNRTEPLSFTVNGNPPMLPGFTEGVKMLRKGGSGTLYIPSSLGYGANGNPAANIKPNEHLIFEIKIADVKDKEPEIPSAPHPPASKVDTTQKNNK